MKKHYAKLSSTVAWISSLAWPSKLVVGALLSAITGGGLLTFLMQNAAYAFALTYGFRPPVEGVPYVGPIVAIASLALLLAGVALAISGVAMIRGTLQFLRWLQRYDRSTASTPLRLLQSLTPSGALVALPALAAIFTVVLHNVLPRIENHYGRAESLIFIEQLVPIWLFEFLLALAVTFCLWRPSMVFIGAAANTMIYYVMVGLAVLPPDAYAALLRKTGFGGGINVSIEFRDPAGKAEVMNAYLLLRSATSLVVYDEGNGSVHEYPMDKVWRVSLRTGGLKAQSFRLPPKTDDLQ